MKRLAIAAIVIGCALWQGAPRTAAAPVPQVEPPADEYHGTLPTCYVQPGPNAVDLYGGNYGVVYMQRDRRAIYQPDVRLYTEQGWDDNQAAPGSGASALVRATVFDHTQPYGTSAGTVTVHAHDLFAALDRTLFEQLAATETTWPAEWYAQVVYGGVPGCTTEFVWP